ncbi:piRNA biogenesis protein EXD1 isoform X2 [Pelobates fuscus]|uniref:piRNA biogenesis protein EXD1 isoform X2 n=1 Tax=Pelobates fuscus TaxID=191477 RepID=UPI002FE44B6E
MAAITDASFLSRVIGKTIKLTTATECLQGELVSVSSDRTIVINKIKDLKTGRKIPGAQLFFGNNILNVEPQDESSGGSESHTAEVGDNTASKEDCSGTDINQNVESRNTPPSHEIHSALQAIKHSVDEEEVEYTVIDQFQPHFGPAIRHLLNQKVLGISAVGLNLCRHGKLLWLQVACKRRIYLFDFLVLGPIIFRNGLQTVLEDKCILKIIHDCRWLGDFLSHQYGVILANVFDTQVADVYLFSVETGGFLPHCTSSLKECLIRHLKIHLSRVDFLTHKETLIKLSSPELPRELQQLSILQQVKRERALKDYDIDNKGFLTRTSS